MKKISFSPYWAWLILRLNPGQDHTGPYMTKQDGRLKLLQLSMFEYCYSRLQVWICHLFCLLRIFASSNFVWISDTANKCFRNCELLGDLKNYCHFWRLLVYNSLLLPIYLNRRKTFFSIPIWPQNDFFA